MLRRHWVPVALTLILLGGAAVRVVGGWMPLEHQEAVGQHDQGQMAMEALPPPALVVIQPTLPLARLKTLLDGE